MDRTVQDALSQCQESLCYPIGIDRGKSGKIGEQTGPAGKPLDPLHARDLPKGSREVTSLSRVNYRALLRTVISRLGHSPLQGFAGKNLGHHTARGQLRCKSTERGILSPKGDTPPQLSPCRTTEQTAPNLKVRHQHRRDRQKIRIPAHALKGRPPTDWPSRTLARPCLPCLWQHTHIHTPRCNPHG